MGLLKIFHLHIFTRAEVEFDPGPKDEKKIKNKVNELISATGMKVFMPPYVKYSPNPENLGLTFIAGLETSHTTGHFWTKPDEEIMKYPGSCLFQQDFYTCSQLSTDDVKSILNFIGEYKVRQLNAVIYDREKTIARPAVKIKYNYESDGPYETFLKKLKIKYLNSFKPT